MLKTVWAKKFDKSVQRELYAIGSKLVPYELYHTSSPYWNYYPKGADSKYDEMLELKRERLASARKAKNALKQSEDNEPAQAVKKGYYKVEVDEPERIPFDVEEPVIKIIPRDDEDILEGIEDLEFDDIVVEDDGWPYN